MNEEPTDRHDLAPLAVRPHEAARILGMSERTLWTLTKQGGLPHFKVGRLVLYSVDALRQWVNGQAKGGE